MRGPMTSIAKTLKTNPDKSVAIAQKIKRDAGMDQFDIAFDKDTSGILICGTLPQDFVTRACHYHRPDKTKIAFHSYMNELR